MKTEEAKILLQKYFEAETSLEEEKLLSDWFRTDNLPEEFLPYKSWFLELGTGLTDDNDSFGENAFARILSREVPDRKKSRRLWIPVSGIAASLVIILGGILFYHQRQPYRDTFDDPALALTYAEKTLGFVSASYNKGLAQLAPVRHLKTAYTPLSKSMKSIEKGFAQINKIALVNKLNKSR